MAFDLNEGPPNSLPKWNLCVRRLQAGEYPSVFGYTGTRSDLYRFGNRFRFAKSLTGVTLDQYGQSTQDGYAGLLQTFTAWSAFEIFLRLHGERQEDCQPLIDPYDPKGLAERIRNIDQSAQFYEFLKPLVRQKPREQLDKFLNNEECNVTYLASSIRHVFAHGTLAASPGGVDADNIVLITKEINCFLFGVMEADFASRL
jgi:hypothetical protein